MSWNRQPFRELVLEEMDEAYESYNGETPDHMLVSDEVWRRMESERRFERLSNGSYKEMGYIGMDVWQCSSMEKYNLDALLLSEEVFEQIVSRASDYKSLD